MKSCLRLGTEHRNLGSASKGLCKNNLPIGQRQSLGIERSKVAQYAIMGPLSIVQFRGFGVVQSAGYFCTAPNEF